jgi:hypothetical protein
MDLGDLLSEVVTRLPWENLIHPDPDKKLDELRAILDEHPELMQRRAAVAVAPACPNPSFAPTTASPPVPPIPTTASPAITHNLPTTAETVQELKRRLGAELYRLEMDLVGGARIAGKPCDCLMKHSEMGILPTVEELVPMDSSPINEHIINWVNGHLPEFQVDAVAAKDPSYYRQLAPEVRALRKELLGTEKLVAILSDEQKAKVREDAKALLDKRIDTL